MTSIRSNFYQNSIDQNSFTSNQTKKDKEQTNIVPAVFSNMKNLLSMGENKKLIATVAIGTIGAAFAISKLYQIKNGDSSNLILPSNATQLTNTPPIYPSTIAGCLFLTLFGIGGLLKMGNQPKELQVQKKIEGKIQEPPQIQKKLEKQPKIEIPNHLVEQQEVVKEQEDFKKQPKIEKLNQSEEQEKRQQEALQVQKDLKVQSNIEKLKNAKQHTNAKSQAPKEQSKPKDRKIRISQGSSTMRRTSEVGSKHFIIYKSYFLEDTHYDKIIRLRNMIESTAKVEGMNKDDLTAQNDLKTLFDKYSQSDQTRIQEDIKKFPLDELRILKEIYETKDLKSSDDKKKKAYARHIEGWKIIFDLYPSIINDINNRIIEEETEQLQDFKSSEKLTITGQ